MLEKKLQKTTTQKTKSMLTFLPIIFVIGYILIALEHPVRTNKAATALLTGFIIWILLAIWNGEHTITELHEHTGGISEILLFLVGAMIIVQTVDEHGSLAFITNAIGTTNRPKLYAIVGLLTFFLSAVLDNMTTAIVMSAILSKMLKDKEDVWKFAGLVIIAANAGGAWSPIGDVTTIMLWIGGQVTSGSIISRLFLPSLISLASLP
jgi:Na+/H+ antiporter NhaD/arsenite permease-like protein